VDWEKIGELYQAVLKGKAGECLFPAYTLAIATGRDEQGELRLQLKHADRSVLRYTGTLAGSESSHGTFAIDAWGGIVRDALSGSWRMSRVGP